MFTEDKINTEQYICDILEAELLPWTREQFDDAPFDLSTGFSSVSQLQNDQHWIQAHITAFFRKDELPSRSLDLNPFDFSVWSILENKTCISHHASLDDLKA